MHDRYPQSPAYRELQPLRIPSGWLIGWNGLYAASSAQAEGYDGDPIFNATHQGRRFNIDVARSCQSPGKEGFRLTVTYQPWPRDDRGRRDRTAPFAFGQGAEIVHEFMSQSADALVAELEQWIARCSMWEREPN